MRRGDFRAVAPGPALKTTHVVGLLAMLVASTLHAQQAAGEPSQAQRPAPAASPGHSEPLSQGEVRRIDLAQGKVTLRHGPLPNLDMPAMTMVFRAADPKMLEGLHVGDKVRFTAEDRAGVLTIVDLRAAGN